MDFLKDLVINNKPTSLFLMEIKISKDRVQAIARKLGFQNSEIVKPRGIAGGIAFLWKDEVSLQLDWSSDWLIFLNVL